LRIGHVGGIQRIELITEQFVGARGDGRGIDELSSEVRKLEERMRERLLGRKDPGE
jgi:hypothetical protein